MRTRLAIPTICLGFALTTSLVRPTLADQPFCKTNLPGPLGVLTNQLNSIVQSDSLPISEIQANGDGYDNGRSRVHFKLDLIRHQLTWGYDNDYYYTSTSTDAVKIEPIADGYTFSLIDHPEIGGTVFISGPSGPTGTFRGKHPSGKFFDQRLRSVEVTRISKNSERDQKFLTAVKTGDLEKVTLYLDSRIPVDANAVDSDGNSALLLALKSRDPNIWRLLLGSVSPKFDINQTVPNGESCASYALAHLRYDDPFFETVIFNPDLRLVDHTNLNFSRIWSQAIDNKEAIKRFKAIFPPATEDTLAELLSTYLWHRGLTKRDRFLDLAGFLKEEFPNLNPNGRVWNGRSLTSEIVLNFNPPDSIQMIQDIQKVFPGFRLDVLDSDGSPSTRYAGDKEKTYLEDHGVPNAETLTKFCDEDKVKEFEELLNRFDVRYAKTEILYNIPYSCLFKSEFLDVFLKKFEKLPWRLLSKMGLYLEHSSDVFPSYEKPSKESGIMAFYDVDLASLEKLLSAHPIGTINPNLDEGLSYRTEARETFGAALLSRYLMTGEPKAKELFKTYFIDPNVSLDHRNGNKLDAFKLSFAGSMQYAAGFLYTNYRDREIVDRAFEIGTLCDDFVFRIACIEKFRWPASFDEFGNLYTSVGNAGTSGPLLKRLFNIGAYSVVERMIESGALPKDICSEETLWRWQHQPYTVYLNSEEKRGILIKSILEALVDDNRAVLKSYPAGWLESLVNNPTYFLATHFDDSPRFRSASSRLMELGSLGTISFDIHPKVESSDNPAITQESFETNMRNYQTFIELPAVKKFQTFLREKYRRDLQLVTSFPVVTLNFVPIKSQ